MINLWCFSTVFKQSDNSLASWGNIADCSFLSLSVRWHKSLQQFHVFLLGVAKAFNECLYAHPELVKVCKKYFGTDDLKSPKLKMAHVRLEIPFNALMSLIVHIAYCILRETLQYVRCRTMLVIATYANIRFHNQQRCIMVLIRKRDRNTTIHQSMFETFTSFPVCLI